MEIGVLTHCTSGQRKKTKQKTENKI